MIKKIFYEIRLNENEIQKKSNEHFSCILLKNDSFAIDNNTQINTHNC